MSRNFMASVLLVMQVSLERAAGLVGFLTDLMKYLRVDQRVTGTEPPVYHSSNSTTGYRLWQR
jgi:hypothetical protein